MKSRRRRSWVAGVVSSNEDDDNFLKVSLSLQSSSFTDADSRKVDERGIDFMVNDKSILHAMKALDTSKISSSGIRSSTIVKLCREGVSSEHQLFPPLGSVGPSSSSSWRPQLPLSSTSNDVMPRQSKHG
jgi:hypothetical protein